jgi:hypothetical protein
LNQLSKLFILYNSRILWVGFYFCNVSVHRAKLVHIFKTDGKFLRRKPKAKNDA